MGHSTVIVDRTDVSAHLISDNLINGLFLLAFFLQLDKYDGKAFGEVNEEPVKKTTVSKQTAKKGAKSADNSKKRKKLKEPPTQRRKMKKVMTVRSK
ncbi:protein RCC2-like protein [Senna tora]|uniref:Protein RCC2-like protein n=1 Tax=Senna tora TaxID=362788 RepID=A0A834WD11_9FABA|nr:protein RCC2-like protein [Senna tora]